MSQVKAAGKRLVVIGGGISGLSFLHYVRNFAKFFKKEDRLGKMILVETNDYMGGSISSKRFEDGISHELGPRSLRTTGKGPVNNLILLEELKMGDLIRPVFSFSPAARNRYIYLDNKLHKAPQRGANIFYRIPKANSFLFKSVIHDLRTKKMDLSGFENEDPPLYDFIKHRFGHNVAEYLLVPLMRGITASDARLLSTKALFGEFLQQEQAYGSIIKGILKPPLNSTPHDELYPNEVMNSEIIKKLKKDQVSAFIVKGGLQTITERIADSLMNTNTDGKLSIYNQTKAIAIRLDSNDYNEVEDEDEDGAPCSVRVQTIDGDQVDIKSDHIVAALPSSELYKLLENSFSNSDLDCFAGIRDTKHSPVATVCLEFRKKGKEFKLVDNSGGYLSHPSSDSCALGTFFDSSYFPDEEHPDVTKLTCMFGGSWYKEIFGTSDLNQVSNAQLEDMALKEIRNVLKITQDPYRIISILWKTGIAMYEPGHKERVQMARDMIDSMSIPITLIGQSYDGIALGDVTFSARRKAYEFIKKL